MPDVPVPYDIRFEHLRKPLGIGEERPRISWSLADAAAPFSQAAAEIRVQSAAGGEPAVWRLESADRVLVPWPDEPLTSRERRTVAVRVFGEDGVASDWSEPAWVECGLLEPSDWIGAMIGPPAGSGGPLPLVRRGFELEGTIARARLYVTAHGVYNVEINGSPVSDDVLAPGWQSYSHRLRYQTYDVTSFLVGGANAIGIRLGDGWYRGRLGFLQQRAIYGDDLAVQAQLEVTFADGTSFVLVSDAAWMWAPGPIVSSDLYDGETYDAGREIAGWSRPDADGRGEWQPVEARPADGVPLVAPTGPPVRPTAELSPTAITSSPLGKTLVDFGQNIVGFVRLTVDGPEGHLVTIRHAEVLENGELGVRPLRTAQATDRYRLKGRGPETWQPAFTFHGFRYVEVDGWPQETLDPSAITAVVVHTDMERTGWFESDHALLNRLHENVVWAMRGNFLDVPTDCPQRDERLGWTGDISVFAPTATFLYDCAGMLRSWLRDLAAEQRPDGLVPFFVPEVPFPEDRAHIPIYVHAHAGGWGDAAVTVPHALYEAYGDAEILAAQYPSMKSWVDGVARLAGDDRLWDSGFQFGDWLDPTAPPDRPEDAATDKYLVATAYFAQSTRLLADAAAILGFDDDAAAYRTLAAEVVAAFQSHYIRGGELTSDTQTAYALGLCFDLIAPADREHAGRRLIELVRRAGHTIATGFIGTPLILDALVLAGGLDDAYRLLLQTECPSWLYTVKQGGTTIWERWDSMLPDGRINPGEMTSFNHYALGAVASWLHRTVGGLAPAAPGYRALRIAPRPGGGLTRASVSHRTPYGVASVAWVVEEAGLRVEADVPMGVTATVELPGVDVFDVGGGSHSWLTPLAAETSQSSGRRG